MEKTSDLILKDLNPAQREAVTAPDGPLLVFAGAGSGKTRVLTRRIAYLLTECEVHPSEILAVTFTNKAARLMADRVEQLIGRHAHGMWLHTFHGACARLLRGHAELVGRTSAFSIYDQTDQQTLLKELLPQCDIDPKEWTPRQIAHWFDLAKNEGHDPTEEVEAAPVPIREKYRNLTELYRRRVREANACDFGDLLVEALRLLRENPAVRDLYRRRFRHLLVDEFQDTNHAQYQLLLELLGEHRNLTAVGDDDQSIYRWRGARIENILGFQQQFPDARLVVLSTNYRSTERILQAANAVIRQNRGRQPKEMDTPNPAGPPLVRFEADDEYDEARYVARRIDELRLQRGLRPGEIAVFFRMNAQSRILEEKLLERGIPYNVVGGLRFYDRKEIKDAVAYLRLLINPADAIALARAINTPPRGVGDKTLERLVEMTQTRDLTPIDACAAIAAGAGERIGAKVRQEMGKFAGLITQCRAEAAGARPSLVASRVLHESGYLKMLEASNKIEDRSRLENVNELLKSIEEFEKEAGDEAGLELFLEKISLLSDPDLYDERAESVSLMTLHTAKGLEFPAVFIVGMEEGILPHSLSMNDPAQLEEERRLCYVGMTRAEKWLTLVAAAVRRAYGGFPKPTRLSPFWFDVPAEVVEDQTVAPAAGSLPFVAFSADRAGGPPRDNRAAFRRPTASEPRRTAPAEPEIDFSDSQDPADHAVRLTPGRRVRHPQFGLGTVQNISGRGQMARATVKFDRVGVKTLVIAFAHLQPIS